MLRWTLSFLMTSAILLAGLALTGTAAECASNDAALKRNARVVLFMAAPYDMC
jgi:hypothetical protein